MTKALGKFIGSLLGAFVSWGFCCLMLWAISMCFDFSISLKQATGVWLAVIFIRWSFNIRNRLK